MTNRKLATATLLGIVSVGLVGCGAGSSSHVVARIAPASTSVTAAPTSGPGTVPGSGDVGATSTTTASDSLNPQTLDQVGADLGTLDNNFNTANSDLTHPQGDS
jgi:hypothetical protein